jgi:hypothetical protein
MGFFGWLIILGGGGVALVLSGLVYVPPYFANSDIKQAVEAEVTKADPSADDEAILRNMNADLQSAHTSRYWVDNGKQQQAEDFQLTSDMVTFTRDGNRQLSADVEYTQTMWIPILGRVKPLTYHLHVDGPTH